MTNKNNIDEILEEFDKIYPRIMKINHSIERRESIKNFLKQKLQEVKQNTIEEIISKIKTQEIAKDKVGSFYDGYICLKDQILYYLKNK